LQEADITTRQTTTRESGGRFHGHPSAAAGDKRFYSVALAGIAYYDLEQYEQAVSDFSNAIDLNTDDILSLKTRGWAYQKLGQLDPALRDLTTCIERKPSVRHHYVERASIHRDRGEFEAALFDFEKAIAIDPDNDTPDFRRSEAYTRRGDVYVDDLHRCDQAAQEYAEAIRLDPQSAVFFKKRDRAQQAAG